MNKKTFFKWLFCSSLTVFAVGCSEKNEEKRLPIESRYELNILAKKYEIPLETAHKLFLRKDRVRDSEGHSDWKASIEKASKDTGIPEKVIAAFLVDMQMIYNLSGGYADQNSD